MGNENVLSDSQTLGVWWTTFFSVNCGLGVAKRTGVDDQSCNYFFCTLKQATLKQAIDTLGLDVWMHQPSCLALPLSGSFTVYTMLAYPLSALTTVTGGLSGSKRVCCCNDAGWRLIKGDIYPHHHLEFTNASFLIVLVQWWCIMCMIDPSIYRYAGILFLTLFRWIALQKSR